MRYSLILLIAVAIAYWIDQTYYGGVYSRAVFEMLRQISNGYWSA